jgi:hypothetical protein
MLSAGLALVACSGDHAPLTKDAATLLQAQVGNARTAASRGDAATAISQLDQARQSLDRLRQQGFVTRTRADEITVAIAATQNALRAGTSSSTAPETGATSEQSTDTAATTAPASVDSSEPSTSEPSTTTSTFPTATSDQQGDHGNGRGRGNGG